MRYELSSGRLTPQVIWSLRALTHEAKEQEGGLMAHPHDILLSVTRELIESGLQLCIDHKDALESTEDFAKEKSDIRLRKSLRGFHSCLADYINACRTISKAVIGKEKAARIFRNAAGEYYDHVMTIENFIKHQHRTLRTVYASWAGYKMIGYQVEATIGKGAVGAEPHVHRYPGTAFSINRELVYHACHIYFIANTLNSTLGFPSPALTEGTSSPLENLFREFLDLASDIPRLYFPDEINLPVPRIKKRIDDGYLIEFPSSAKPDNRRPHVMNLTFVAHPTAHTHTIELPYLGKERPWEHE